MDLSRCDDIVGDAADDKKVMDFCRKTCMPVCEEPTAAPTTFPSESPSQATARPSAAPSDSTNAPTPTPLKTIIKVNVSSKLDNGFIEQQLLVITLGETRRLGATVSLLEEQDAHDEHRKLVATTTITVSSGTATIRVEFITNIACSDMFGSSIPIAGNICGKFEVVYFFTGVDVDVAQDLVGNVDRAVTAGSFTVALGFCAVLDSDTVDEDCIVV